MKIQIRELRSAEKDLAKAPKEILISYETWVRLIEEHGLSILRKFKGYHDEKLEGKLLGYRSSRLNRKWRVIYRMDKDGGVVIVEVKRVTPHEYHL